MTESLANRSRGARRRLRPVLLMLGLALAAIAAPGDARRHTPSPFPAPDPVLLAALDALHEGLRHGEGHRLEPHRLRPLLTALRRAKVTYLARRQCHAAKALDVYLHHVQRLRGARRPKVTDGPYNEGRRIRDGIVAAAPPDARCHDPRLAMTGPEVVLHASDPDGLSATVAFGTPRFETRVDDGRSWTRVQFAGLTTGVADGGTPGVPVIRRLIAVPEGAEAVLAGAIPRVAETLALRLYPLQLNRDRAHASVSEPADGPPPPAAYFDRAFEIDGSVYASSARYPAQPCRVAPLGRSRDLSVAVIECAAGHYAPADEALTLYAAIDVTVAFVGSDTGTFIPDTALGPFETLSSMAVSAVLNTDAVMAHQRRATPQAICSGEELLILTHPEYAEAAHRLADWKRSRGIVTSVAEVNDGGGPGPDTAAQIDAYIEQRFASCLIRPSYLILVGDVDDVPTFVLPELNAVDQGDIASDFPYACIPGICDPADGDDVLPSLAVGRLTVRNTFQANAVVDKIVRYEGTPPELLTFYQRATVASYFQCCRTDVTSVPDAEGIEDQRGYIAKSESIRNLLLNIGFDVDRIYATSTEYHDDYTGDPTPRYYDPGVPLPPSLSPASGFAWDGTGDDLAAAMNDGRFLVVHLDHGYASGWVHPAFSQAQAVTLGNDELLPVLFELDCSTGAFDTTPISLVEALLHNANGGVIGALAWTRVSSSTLYPATIEGVFDAVWPDLIPDFGNPFARARLGEMLTSAHLRIMASAAGASQSGGIFRNAVDHVRMLHLFGDPTLAMWVGDPIKLPREAEILVGPEGPEIYFGIEGAVITGVQITDAGVHPVGRATVVDGVARLDYLPLLPGVPLQLSAGAANAVGSVLAARVR